MRYFAVFALIAFGLCAGCGSTLRTMPDASFQEAEPFLFRARGTLRMFDISSRGGVMLVNEIVVTPSSVIAFTYDGKNKRPFTTARLARANIARVTDDYMSFAKLEMVDGVTHWVEIDGGKKPEFIRALSK